MTWKSSVVVMASFMILAGCSKTSSDESTTTVIGADGSKSTVQKNASGGSNVTVTGADGSKATMSSDKNGSVEIKGPQGSASMGGNTSVTEAELGVAFYPGSTEKSGSVFKVDMPDEKGVSCVRTTTDEPSKVADFYKGKVQEIQTMTSGDMTLVSGKIDGGATVAISATKKDGKTEISYTMSLKKKK